MDGPRPRSGRRSLRERSARAGGRAGRGGDRLAGRSDRRRCAGQAQLCGHVGRPGRLRLEAFQQHNLAARDLWRDFRRRRFPPTAKWPTRGSRTSTTKTLKASTSKPRPNYRFDPTIRDRRHLRGQFTPPSGGRILYFNYRSIFDSEEDASPCHEKFVADPLPQRSSRGNDPDETAGDVRRARAAVCKKLRDRYQKDYEPYPTMGPLAGVFPSGPPRSSPPRDMLGFDAISIGGVVSWLMGVLRRATSRRGTGVSGRPAFRHEGFARRGRFGAHAGSASSCSTRCRPPGAGRPGRRARALAGGWRATRGKAGSRRVRLRCVRARRGWMVRTSSGRPASSRRCRSWGKYSCTRDGLFAAPRAWAAAPRADEKELILDNMGACRFHRGWGGGHVAGDPGSVLRAQAALPAGNRHDGQPHQQPQRVAVLGIGAELRLRAHVSPRKRLVDGDKSRSWRVVAQAFDNGQARGRPRFLVRDAQGNRGNASRSSDARFTARRCTSAGQPCPISVCGPIPRERMSC